MNEGLWLLGHWFSLSDELWTKDTGFSTPRQWWDKGQHHEISSSNRAGRRGQQWLVLGHFEIQDWGLFVFIPRNDAPWLLALPPELGDLPSESCFLYRMANFGNQVGWSKDFLSCKYLIHAISINHIHIFKTEIGPFPPWAESNGTVGQHL